MSDAEVPVFWLSDQCNRPSPPPYQSSSRTALLSPPLGEVGRGSGRVGVADLRPIVIQVLSPTFSESGERRLLFL